MSTEESAKATIEAVFEQIAWSRTEEALTASHDIEIFTRSKLVLKRTTPEAILSQSKANFVKNANLVRVAQRTGFTETDIELNICFDEDSGKVKVDLNSFLPYYFVLIENASRTLMAHGKAQDFFVVNPPVLKADVLSLCQHILEAEDIYCPERKSAAGGGGHADFMTFLLDDLGFGKDKDEGKQLASEIQDLASEITREVNSCKMINAVKKTSKQPFTYSKLAGVIVTFKVIGEPNYEGTTFEFSYSDDNPEAYEALTDELVETRPDLVMLGINHK